MPRTPFDDLIYRLGRVTFATCAVIVVASVAAVGFGSLDEWTALFPALVLHGQVWRLITYPWIQSGPYMLIFGPIMIGMFMSTLENAWRERTLLFRMGMGVIIPAAITSVLMVPFPSLRGQAYLGIQPLLSFIIVAFATEMRGARVMMFPLPVQLSGDGLLLFEAAFLAAFCLFGGVGGQLPSILSFGLGLAWFRFGSTRELRRTWLKLRQRMIQMRLQRMKKARSLRVVSRDDTDDGPYLN